jgi:hypothetical protein
MKKTYILILLIVAIIAFIVSYLVRQESTEKKSDKPVSKPNVVSQAKKKALPSGFDQEKWQKEHDKKMAQHEQFWLSFLAERDIESMNSKPTYTEAYRDYVYYEGCHQIINNILNNMEPFYFVLRRNQSFNDLALNQQQALEERLSKCIQLSDFGQRSYDAGFAQQSLKQRYEAILPKTDKEQQLAATLKMIKDLNFNKSRLSSEQRGENIDPQLHVELFTIRRELQNQSPKPATIFGGYNEADQLIVDELRSQIADIDQQILDNKYIDEAQVDKYKAEVERLKSALQIMLVETTSSDAYLALYDLIKVDNQDINTDSLKAQLTGGVELIPQAYKAYLIPILVHFRACELSHPCGQESLLVEQQCLNFRNEKAPQACGGDLIDFYLNHYLSPNQLFDVEYVLSEGYSS